MLYVCMVLIGRRHWRGWRAVCRDRDGAAFESERRVVDRDFLARDRPPEVLIGPANHAYQLLWRVVEGADPAASDKTVKARTINNGQSCIAAKRFIVADPVYDEFERRFVFK